MSYKVILRWLLFVLGLEVPRWGQSLNKCWLLLVLGLGPFRENYRACEGQILLV